MDSMDLRFFTNEEGATLLDRFKQTLANETQFFDVLVGYFRSSGFFLLYPSFKTVEKIRILVGLNIDKVTYQLVQEGKDGQKSLFSSTKNIQEGFEDQVTREVEECEDSKRVEEGIEHFIDFIKSGKLEIKVYPEHPIHAKVYILRKKEGHEDFGKVITGSSNFSQAGLVDNLEFNVELKDAPDVKFALNRFEELWKKAIDVTDEYVDTVHNKTWLNNTITPYELYLKFLYEYFREKINYDKEMFEDLPKGYLDLEYQKEAVADALLKVREHNGVFLSDVVGLGKTFIAALLARKLGGRSLVICPPVLKEYWEDVLREFGVVAKVESHGKLEHVLKKGTEFYDQVIIDEAHRFRNEITKSFELLHQICAGKKVILVTATPLNNRPKDIASQLYLFQKRNNSTIPNLKNLRRFFTTLDKNLDSKLSKEEYLEVVKENSKIIRESVLKYAMVRRTRAEVEKFYKEDLEQQGLEFPKDEEPKKLFYDFDDNLDDLFNDTLSLIRKISYARYEPVRYIKTQTETQDLQTQRISQQNVRGFMKGLLVKRLESSFHAFRQTLKRFIDSYDKFIEMFDSGKVYVSKKVDVYDLLETDREEELEQLIDEGEAVVYESSGFQEGYRDLLVADKEYLQELIHRWNQVDEDPKLKEFLSTLKSDEILKKNKVLIFTESRETGEYLFKNLKEKFGDQVVLSTGMSKGSEMEVVRANFDPMHRFPKNKKRLLVTTDVLSEGINLHRANVIVNYDIPWNSVRILQRVGRVNRVGTKHDKVHIYNFFPTSQAEREIGLEKLAVAKIQAFHDTLGEDTKYLTGDEEFASWEIFSRINSTKALDEKDSEVVSELEYLREIRDIRDKDEMLYEKVKKLPKKARTARKNGENQNSVITFFRKGSLKKFFKASGDESQELDFFDAAEILKVGKNEKRYDIPTNFYRLLYLNKDSFENSLQSDEDEAIQKKGTGNEKTLLKTVKALMNLRILTEDDEAYLQTLVMALDEGSVSKKSVNKAVRRVKANNDPIKIFAEIKRTIPDEYLLNLTKRDGRLIQTKKEIILSEALV